MMKSIYEKISPGISTERMLTEIRELSNFHRIQASEGYRESAKLCCEWLKKGGIPAEVRSYPADENTQFLTMGSFLEWNCSFGNCTMIYPEHLELADYLKEPLSLIQKSYPTSNLDVPIELIYLEKGLDPEFYRETDFHNKIIFVRDSFSNYMDWAFKEKGALGIISDYVVEVPGGRTREDLKDTLKYNTFWYTDGDREIRPFGFVLTPRMGDYLAKLCRQLQGDYENGTAPTPYPKLQVSIHSKLEQGFFENVVGYIEGETENEILVLAHLCHPKTSANDNGSGVAAVTEAVRVINEGIQKGELEKPWAGIRVLFMPEFTGTYAYLQERGSSRSRILAGMNLDMVGGRQDLGYGPLTLSGLPRSTPSFVWEVGLLVLEELRREVPGFSPEIKVSMFNSATTDFTTGSDHFILSDPTIGIPTLMLGQWPDKFYHTSGDTIQVISPELMKKSALFAGMYLYTLANLKEDLVESIVNRGILHFHEDLYKLKNAEFLCEYYTKVLDSLEEFRISMGRKKSITISGGKGYYKKEMEILFGTDSLKSSKAEVLKEYSLIPVREYIGPINNLGEHVKGDLFRGEALADYLHQYGKAFRDRYYGELLIQYYIDGKRTILEISKRMCCDCQCGTIEAVNAYILLLQKFGFVKLGEVTPKKSPRKKNT